ANKLDVANWPLYIDKEGKTESGVVKGGTVADFNKATGIDTKYVETISDNEEFFGTDIRSQLASDQPTGWDIMVMTDWMIAKLIDLGFVQPLHQDLLPNPNANLDPKFQNPWFDPGNAHSYPWAAGITGIGYDSSRTGRDITSIEDLFDPEFEGKIGMFSEMRDSYNFMFHRMGVDPVEATIEDVQEAQRMLLEQRPLVRGYYGNDYTDQLAAGNLWITMAWSGDIFALALDNPDLKWVLPEEGGNRWSDNMVIPILAEHPTDAHEWINFVYEPKIATQITEWVWYESPVVGIQERIEKDGQDRPNMAKLASDPFVWPDEEVLSNTSLYKRLTPEEEKEWQQLFDQVILG
ncbi:MAG: spermidine/putrescine ABC transporter substrate-binding protein, partial [Actinomycetota bacterium]